MKTKELILKTIKSKGIITTPEIVKIAKISRQTAAQHFRELIIAKKIIKLGSTHNARYITFSKKRGIFFKKEPFLAIQYSTKNLQEDVVFEEVSIKMGLNKRLSKNAYKIINYAFTEMLNNAIEHSKSKKVQVNSRCLNGEFEFAIIDRGIGVFENIRKKFKLKNEFEAIEHLLKGKQTTAPQGHSGQGIFFTSKIADSFILESHRLKLIVDNQNSDLAVNNIKLLNGTMVHFHLKQKSRKKLSEIFQEFQNSDYEFDKTKISVKITLHGKNGEYVSRSEAKRLLFGLDKFKRIIIDFKGVKGIGQGFADEIFRIYKFKKPDIEITPINTSLSVDLMIKRAISEPYN